MIPLLLRDLESVFGWLLAASWQASVLALLVLGLQGALRGRLNPRWRYALWLLVLARLVLPALPESALSLFQFAPPPPVAIVVPMTEPLFVPTSLPPSQVDVPIAEPGHPFSFYSLLAVTWLAGAAALLVLTWQVNRRFAREVGNSPEITDPGLLKLFAVAKAELGVHRSIRLIENGQVQSPAIMGLFQPTLLLPADVRAKFDVTELRLIFLHELAHLKRGDVTVQALIALLQILHWFNPVLWYAFRRMRIDREPATDALVLSRTGEEEKERYGLMLIKLLEHFNQRHSLPTLVGILEDKDQFKRRFSLIARFTRGAYGWSLLGILLIGVLGVACLTKSKATETPDPTKSPVQTYLEVTYVETIDTSAMPGSVTIPKNIATTMIQNPKNKPQNLIDFPLKAGMNTIKGKTPSGFDYTIDINWKDSLANQAQDLAIKEEWLNANGGGVSYGSQFKASLHSNDCFLITGPWKTKETSNLLIGFVDHPSEQPPKADAAPAAPFQDVAIGGKVRFARPELVDLAKSVGYLASPVDGGGTEFTFQPDGSFALPHVKRGFYNRHIRFVRKEKGPLPAESVDMPLSPLAVDGSAPHMTMNLNLDVPFKDVAKGSIEVGLKVVEIPDDVYLANQAAIDAGVEKGGAEIFNLFNNLKGVSLLSAPSVTTKPGQKANIDIVREFPYPISFESAKVGLDSSGKLILSVPPTPREFATKNVGVSAEITSSLDQEKILVNGEFSVTCFEGFTKSNLTSVNMPCFSTRESLFLEALDDNQEKGVWIPGEHVGEETMVDGHIFMGQNPTGKKIGPTEFVKKRLLVFLSARLLK